MSDPDTDEIHRILRYDDVPPGRFYPEEGIPGPPIFDARQLAFLRNPLDATIRSWMYNGGSMFRKTGRTFALAHWHIRRAWNEDLGKKVILVDHSQDEYGSGRIYDQVLKILRDENLAMCHGSGGPWIWATPEMKANPESWDDWDRKIQERMGSQEWRSR